MQLKRAIIQSENSIIIYFNTDYNPKTLNEMLQFKTIIYKQLKQYILNIVLSYQSMTIFYKINHITAYQLCDIVNNALEKNSNSPHKKQKNKHINIPVYYHPSIGLDIEKIINEKNITLNQLIQLHTNHKYLVYAIGFLPNFAYLGKVNTKLNMPRLKKPRKKVPPSSVAIANRQTAIYPQESPGGWHIIGKTPINLNTANINFSIGDTVSFYSIDKQEFQALNVQNI